MCLNGNRDMWKSWRVTSCCISEICQKRLVGERQLTESCHRGLGRIGGMIYSGVMWWAVNYTGKEPRADAMLRAGLGLLHRLSIHRVAIGSRSTHLAVMGWLLFLALPLSQPSSVTGLRQKRWAICSVFLSLVSWGDKKARVGMALWQEQRAVWIPRGLFYELSLLSWCGKLGELVRA